MSQKIISQKEEVILFLKNLKEVLTDPGFDISKNLDILLKKKTELPTDPYTTFNTIQELEFNRYDVMNQLLAVCIN